MQCITAKIKDNLHKLSHTDVIKKRRKGREKSRMETGKRKRN